MPETLDFDQIAVRLLHLVTDSMDPLWKTGRAKVRGELVKVWNARGAADIAKMEGAFDGTTPSMETLDQALRSLDR